MNEIVNKFLLAGNKFISEMHLKQPGFTYSACGSFPKNKKIIQNFKEMGDTSMVHKCFDNKTFGGAIKSMQN